VELPGQSAREKTLGPVRFYKMTPYKTVDGRFLEGKFAILGREKKTGSREVFMKK